MTNKTDWKFGFDSNPRLHPLVLELFHFVF